MDRARIVPAVVSVALVAATLSPLVRDPTDDGFPLSSYAMFAVRPPTTATIDYALGETAAGVRRTLVPAHLGTGEVLQAFAIVARAVNDPAARAVLCSAIAARVASDPDYRDVTTIRIVTGIHDPIGYLVRGAIGREAERTRCAVRR